MHPTEIRLRSEYEKVKKLVEGSGGTLRLIRIIGNPPRTYVIEYHCPSLVRDQNQQITVRNQHQVEIVLGQNYPFNKPTAKMLTSVFNPHIFANNAICLGINWNPTETIDMVILKIGALLQLDPRVLDKNSPANSEANLWVQQNPTKIPLGTVSFKAGATPAAKRIQWTG